MTYIRYFLCSLICFGLMHWLFGSFKDLMEVFILAIGTSAMFMFMFRYLLRTKARKIGYSKEDAYYARPLANLLQSCFLVETEEYYIKYPWSVLTGSSKSLLSSSKEESSKTNYVLFTVIVTPTEKYLVF